ncbi:cytochrome c biogenesis protein ResB [Microcella humidisoli]|uniref:Cytochrome c biogenesis protein ResB n=1 Tax=Microcella humidisoli TaxID=2963406 RepID=A0ABY5FY97_9MICO|nr:cytochrome c biogenesis protein ResB [Microcella humidisoli]UTT63269.1 cytochrome c biogenesis protein ResB [Microcella humidisoli]
MEPLRPSDHHDSDAPAPPSSGIAQPKLDAGGWLRFGWRQLTSMRTALVLLLLLAVAAIPGSLVPQRSADPNGVVQFEENNPDLFPILDALQVFDTYSSVWFSAIYLLLFVSLIGCVIPRTQHHWRALRAAPPATPARLNRLVGHTERRAPVDAAAALEAGERLLRRQGYRVARYGDSLSAERGYLRETGNLVFHFALVGVLLTVGMAGGFGYNGQRVIIEGQTFTNQLTSFDSFNPGRFFDETRLDPFSVRLDEFEPVYDIDTTSGVPVAIPLDYTASVTVVENGVERSGQIKVNEPIAIGGTTSYLLGNGFAPWITVYDPEGTPVFSQPVPFLPQDANLTSLGVVKVPDGLDEQVGLLGFFYPSAVTLESGALASIFPEPDQPVLTLNAFTGDLGINEGVPRNVYSLNVDELTQITGGETGTESLVLALGDTAELPDGLGSVEFSSLPRFISIDVHHDPTQAGVLISSVLAFLGLLTSLFVPRRRLWIAVEDEGEGAGVRLQYAGLARGDDPGLERAVTELADAHEAALTAQPIEPVR